MNATVVPTRGPKPIDPALPRHESIVHALIDAARRAPDRTALICRDRSITYDQYACAAAGLACKLSTLGVAGSRGVVLMANGIEQAVAFMGIMGARGQKSSMNPNYTERELVPMLKDADPAVIVEKAASRRLVKLSAAERTRKCELIGAESAEDAGARLAERLRQAGVL